MRQKEQDRLAGLVHQSSEWRFEVEGRLRSTWGHWPAVAVAVAD